MEKVIIDENVLTQELKVLSGDCDFQKRLTLIALQRRLQEVAHLHASHQKFDTESLCGGHYHWVLGRLSIQLNAVLPHWKDPYSLQTAVTGYDRLFAYRNFEFFHEGVLLGRAASAWVLLDAVSRKPADPSLAFSCTDQVPNFFTGDYACRRLRTTAEYQWSLPFEVGYRDVDLHNHVNNTRYAAYILDRFPRSHFQGFRPAEFHINFLQEVVWGDTIKTGTVQNGDDRYQHAIVRADGTVCALAESVWVDNKR